MSDFKKMQAIMQKLINLAEDIQGMLDEVEQEQSIYEKTVERLEEEVADLTSDLEEARQANS